ncbi:MAG: SUMF1/EgtB/PvdO family nonheme iron enzyme [Pseudomonadota bacterium]
MTDIFISYAREDKAKAAKLTAALQAQGWSVWWDARIPAGKTFHEVIEAALHKARCVVVVWSKHSVTSDWVMEEAEEGRRRKILIPVVIDDVNPPMGFRLYQTAQLGGWDGDPGAQVFEELRADVADLLGEKTRDAGRADERPASPPKQEKHSAKKPRKPSGRVEPIDSRSAQTTAQPDPFLEPEMVYISVGRFLMGSPKSRWWSWFFDKEQPDERQHEVVVDDFAMGKYPVTFAEYDAFCEATGRKKPADEGWGRNRRPVINVSWKDAFDYADWLSTQTGTHYRLPTEAEWEYAARGSMQTAYWWGDEFEEGFANCNGSHQQTTPVDAFKPNPFGLFDMLGNVWEWTGSVYASNYDGSEKRSVGKIDPGRRVIRGGSWLYDPGGVRSAYRDGGFPDAPNSVTTPGAAGLYTFGTLDFSAFSAVMRMIRTDSRVEMVSDPQVVVSHIERYEAEHI